MSELKVLVVDDEARMRKLVKDFLVKKDYKVLEANDGEEALSIFFNNKDIDLIILDLMMPKLDGLKSLKMISSIEKDNHTNEDNFSKKFISSSKLACQCDWFQPLYKRLALRSMNLRGRHEQRNK